MIDNLNLVFDLRRIAKTGKGKNLPLWPMSRVTSKGLRHRFDIAMLLGERALPITILRDLMGHSDSKITEIYLQAVGAEKRNMVMNAW